MTNKPMLSVELPMTERQECDLMRFYDTCEDSQPYDVPKDRMKSLARLGLVRSLGFSRYEFTDIGCAAIEKLRAFLDKQSCGACGGCHNGCKLDRESPPIEPAAQHQGEPVAWVIQWGSVIPGFRGHREVVLKDPSPLDAEITPLYAEQPAPVAVVMPERSRLRDLIAEAIGGDTYDCTRVWSAWGVGTMSDDDFVPVVEQDERLYEIADSVLAEVTRLNTPQ